MLLYEEYIERHSLNLNLVKHINHGFLFSRTTKHAVLSIVWTPPDRCPGYYKFQHHTPVRDAHLKNNLFMPVGPCKIVEWDQYEDEFLKYLKEYKPIYGIYEVFVMAWEMFVYSYDTWFATQNYAKEVYATLDQEKSLKERVKSIQDFLVFLGDKHVSIKEAWEAGDKKYLSYYCHWICTIKTKEFAT